MPARLFVVHGSHPCAAVEKALELKEIGYTVWEWPPPFHAPMQKMAFGSRTVPAISFSKNDKVSGSTAIMRRLDEIAPEPRLFPEQEPLRGSVEAAERWGAGDFQQVARDLFWAGMSNSPDSLVSYSENSKLPLPAKFVKVNAPVIAWGSSKLNRTGDVKARGRLEALPAQLDQIDAWIREGVIGDPAHPNAADLQVLATVRILATMADVRPLLDARPCNDAARALYPHWDGELAAGALANL